MTNPFIDRLNQVPAARPHGHGPTPAEIQRWEDDGGAAIPDPAPHSERDRHESEPELAAA